MDNLFDLNDYGEEEIVDKTTTLNTEKIPEIKKESIEEPQSTNLYQIKYDNKEDFLIKIDENLKPISQQKNEPPEAGVNLEDSFEFELNTKINISKKHHDGKEKIKYAIDDDINIEEINKIKEIAITFPFELDIFQKRSIIRLENHQVII
jgi:superfamily II RNA helicase